MFPCARAAGFAIFWCITTWVISTPIRWQPSWTGTWSPWHTLLAPCCTNTDQSSAASPAWGGQDGCMERANSSFMKTTWPSTVCALMTLRIYHAARKLWLDRPGNGQLRASRDKNVAKTGKPVKKCHAGRAWKGPQGRFRELKHNLQRFKRLAHSLQ